MWGKGLPGRRNSVCKAIESKLKKKREQSMFKELQEFSMLALLGVRSEAEEVGRGVRS